MHSIQIKNLRFKEINRFVGILGGMWTLVIVASLVWNILQTRQNTLEIARIQARTAYEKDTIYSLTLMNLDMARQVHDMAEHESDVRGHITSLKPIRPQNAPDQWETEALRAFERGAPEVTSIVQLNGQEVTRLMRPLVTDKRCLPCHESEGYHEGDILGGISVAISMQPLWIAGHEYRDTLIIAHVLLWLTGLGGLGLGRLLLRRTEGQRQTMEAKLTESERRFHSVIKTVNEGITLSDEHGTFIIFNSAMERITGYTMAEANASDDFSKLLYPNPEDRKQALDGLDILLKGAGVLDNIETMICTRSGEKRILLVTTTLVQIDGGKMFLSAYRDITERKSAENQLRLFSYAVRSIAESVSITDLKDNIIFVNKAFVRTYGYKEEEILGQPIALVRSPRNTLEQVRTIHQDTLSGGWEGELWNRKKDGTDFQIHLSSSAIRDEQGTVIALIGIAVDITERKRAEQELRDAKDAAEAATRAKSQFLAMMSHEIRTPMNGVIGMTDLLSQTELTSDQSEYVDTIRVSGEALLTVINDILDFSKIESGKIELEEAPFELRSCIEEVYDLLGSKALEKGLDLLYWIDPEVPLYIVGDKYRLRQILFNLVGNALKFTERGEIYIAVSLKSKIENAFELDFLVKDTGIGIPKDKLDRLFKAFTQVDSSTTRRYGGTGLGLVICARLSELMKGKISVESEEGKGSMFHFTIQSCKADTSMSVPEVYIRGKELDIEGRRVLIVDDNKTNLQILKQLCLRWKLIPRPTSLPKEALEWLNNGDPFDLGILDMLMPDMDGIQLAREIRKLRPVTALPLILLSSAGPGIKKSSMEECLFFAEVSKPIKRSQLFNIVNEALIGVKLHAQRSPKSTSEPVITDQIPLRILIAEDNLVNQKLLSRILNQAGHVADIVGNGIDALAAIEEKPYDIVFMDVHMPEMDGLEASRRIATTYNTEERPTLIALTADAMSGDKERCLEAGMDDYLSKPVRIVEVKAMLRKWALVLKIRRKERT